MLKLKQEYAASEWNKDNERGNRLRCLARRKTDGAPHECTVCLEWFGEDALLPYQLHHAATHTRVCLDCLETRKCISCRVEKYNKYKGEGEHARKKQRTGEM